MSRSKARTSWLERDSKRARLAEHAIVLFYSAIVVFVATCLALLIDRVKGGSLVWLTIIFAVTGTLLMLGGGALMVAESRSSGEQITVEIRHALSKLEQFKS